MHRRHRDDDHRGDLPQRKRKSNNGLIVGLVVGGGLLALLLAGGCVGLLVYRGKADRAGHVAAGPQATTRGEEPIAIPWMAIQDDWRQSAIAAEKKWKGKLVKIGFTVGGMAKSPQGDFYLTGQGGQFFVFVSKAEEDNFAKVRRGEVITIIGRVGEPVRNHDFNEPFYDIYIQGASLISSK